MLNYTSDYRAWERERRRGRKKNFHQVSLITTHFCTHSMSFNVGSLSLIFIFSLLFSVRRSTPLSFIVHYVSCFLVVIPFLPLELLTLYFSVGKVAQNFTDLKLKRLFHRGKNGPEFIQQWHLRWHFIWAMAFAAFGITNTLLKMGKSKVIKSGKKLFPTRYSIVIEDTQARIHV